MLRERFKTSPPTSCGNRDFSVTSLILLALDSGVTMTGRAFSANVEHAAFSWFWSPSCPSRARHKPCPVSPFSTSPGSAPGRPAFGSLPTGRQCHQDRCPVRGRRGRAARRSAPRLGFSEPAPQQAGDDLKSERPEGPRSLQALAEQADVVVENSRPDVRAKLGIDYESLRRINPRIVYGSISGFGQDGPITSVPDSIRPRRAWAG